MEVLIDQYTKEELQQILNTSSSFSDALKKNTVSIDITGK